MEPKLSLVYNSQGGNGLLGMGWSLAGLSVIHRCPKTMVQDGVIGGVNYNANDRYCLDGQRLVAVSGTYGADTTEYRTESESYSRIVSYGSQGSGPAWWKVWTKSGQILEYGNTADSRIEAQGKTEVMLWSLNKLSDTVGNTLTVSYIEDNPNGQYYPDRIDYTGNGNAGKTPGNSVRFVYEARPDITPLYQAGSVNKTTVRLTNVQTFAGSTTVKDYRLAYEQSSSTQRSRLYSLAECIEDGTCLPATNFQWSDSNGHFEGATITNNYGTLSTLQGFLADVNGDGCADVVRLDTGSQQIWTYKSNCNGTFQGATITNNYGTLSTLQGFLADVNGDGCADVVRLDTGSQQIWTYKSNCNGTFQGATITNNYGTLSTLQGFLADVNGDGCADVVRLDTGTQTIYSYRETGEATKLSQITTGLGATTAITYKPLTDSSVYTKDAGSVYPYVDVQSPLYVVSSVAVSDGLGGTYSTYYTYAGAKSHLLGGGFLGFRQVTVHDPQAHIRSTTTYRQDYPYQGQPLSTQKRTNGGVLLSQSLITYTDQLLNTGISPTWHQSLPTHTVESSYELTGGLISTVVTDTQYDAWGNPTAIAVDSGGGYNKTTTNTYDNIIDANRWFLGRLRRSTVTSITP
ncbi:FG-GAP-like repeat-containing protein [Thiobacillus sp.]|uniref:FG-GAP-like repeat-containing protein n=1 Tax=Thiobacillus sp. TaxID=924 RepID=UPI0025CF3F60|nr:FG-GAP-like repeat-containing protein [Thiobacillus sp.]